MDTLIGGVLVINKIIKYLAKSHPDIIPFLKGRALWIATSQQRTEYKSYDYFLTHIIGLVKGLYAGNIGGDFIDIMSNLISGQLLDAYQRAWADEVGEGDMPQYLEQSAENDILAQYDYVDQYYKDIVDARIDKTPIAPLLTRASMWANRWNESYNNGIHLIELQMGGKEVWRLGKTEKHCPDCENLNGIVAYASEWEASGYEPQNAPNEKLKCGGWNCDCERKPTKERVTRGRRARLGI